MQVPAAVDYLRRFDGTMANLIRLTVSLPQRTRAGKPTRGIYIRDAAEASTVVQTQVCMDVCVYV
jgi:hypothetical protein